MYHFIASLLLLTSLAISYGPTCKSFTEITSSSTINSHSTDAPTKHPPTDSSIDVPNALSEEPLTVPSTESSTEAPKGTTAPVPTAQPPSKVAGVCVTSNTGVQNTSPTLTVTWHALVSEVVTYTVKYSTQPGEVNTPPEVSLEVMGINGNSTILTALERGTIYYIWVVSVSEDREVLYSDRKCEVTYKMNATLVAASNTESISTAGAVVGAVVAIVGVLLLIGLIIIVVILLVLRFHCSRKAVGEDVPMEANPAYGEVNLYGTT